MATKETSKTETKGTKTVAAKATATKKVEEKKAPVVAKVEEKKPVATKKVEEKKATPAKKAAEKKPAAKKAPAKKPAAKKKETTERIQQVFVEYQQTQYDTNKMVAQIQEIYKNEGHRVSAIKSLRIYINIEDKRAYYVINDKAEGKFIELD